MSNFNKSYYFIVLNLVFLCSSAFSSASISDIEIVVKETVINAQGFNPISGEPLEFGHIGSLKFEFNDEPYKCLAKVSGLVYGDEISNLKPNTQFLVCIRKDLDGTLWGEIINLIYLP